MAQKPLRHLLLVVAQLAKVGRRRMRAGTISFGRTGQISTIIPGMRNTRQARLNCSVSDQPPFSDELELKLDQHACRRADWHKDKD
jgi:hypothetical protein